MLIPHQTLNQNEKHENLDRWLLTYADLITLLTAFFLMLYSMSVMSNGKFQQVATSVRNQFGGSASQIRSVGPPPIATIQGVALKHQQYDVAMTDLARYVEQHGLDGSVRIRTDQRGIVISLMTDGLLFKSGQAVIQPESQPLLRRVAGILKTLPNSVQVEGHTDDVPIHNAQFASNWELSAARAGAVLRYFIGPGGLPVRRFSAAGYADTRPLVPNDNPHDRARNRRVEIVLLKSATEWEAERLRMAEMERIQVPRL